VQEGAVPGLECFPVPIMRWTEDFYLEVFQKHGMFRLREHGKFKLMPQRSAMDCTHRLATQLGVVVLHNSILRSAGSSPAGLFAKPGPSTRHPAQGRTALNQGFNQHLRAVEAAVCSQLQHSQLPACRLCQQLQRQ